MGNDKYNTNITDKDFTVTGHIKKDTPITANVKTNWNKVTLTVNVNENATGFVKVNIGTTAVNLELFDGVATLTTTLPANSYFAEITYIGDENYNSNATRLAFTVVDIVKNDTPITADIETIENNVTFKVNVDSKASGTVKFQVTGPENYTLYVDVIDGEAVLTDVLQAGNYTLTATYMGDSKFKVNSTSKDFTVKDPKLDADITIEVPEDITAGKDTNINVILPEDATGNITVFVDGEKVSEIPVTNGSAVADLGNLSPGHHDVGILYSGDDKYNAVTKTISIKAVEPILGSQFNVTAGTSIATYAVDFSAGERGATYKFQLTDSEGKPIVNATVFFAYKTVYFNRTTDENGCVLLGISTQFAGEYLCALSYLGDATHNATFVPFSFNVQKKSMTISAAAKSYKASAKTKKYTITLKTQKGVDGKTYLNKGKKVTLKINGKTYTAKTNDKGQATFSLKITKKGKFTAVINFAGDNTYNAATKKVKITIR